MKKTGSAIVVALMLVLSGCMTYRDFPTDYVGQKPPATKPYQKLTYTIDHFNALSLAGAPDIFRHVFRTRTPFAETERVKEVPAKGVHCNVRFESKTISIGAIGALYLSYSTLAVLPAWSTKDGYFVYYDLYVDGEKKKTYQYEVTRKMAVWLGLLPVAWVNAMTYSERDVIEATTAKFFKESEPILAASQVAAAG